MWVLCLQFFVAERLTARGWPEPGYSFLQNAVSDLGVVHCGVNFDPPLCSPLHSWINGSFILQGILMIVGALLLRRAFTAKVGFTVATGLMTASGFGAFWFGAAPVDLATGMHTLATGLYCLCGPAAILGYGLMLLQRPGRSLLAGSASLLTGLITLFAAFIWEFGSQQVLDTLQRPLGMIERVFDYGIPVWLAVAGIVILVRGSREAPPLPRIQLPKPPPPREMYRPG